MICGSIRRWADEIRCFTKAILILLWALVQSTWLQHPPDTAATLLCARILQRAGAPPETTFAFGIRKHSLRDNMLPTEFLISCHVPEKLQFQCCCRLFVWACMALGMDSSIRLHFGCKKTLTAQNDETLITWRSITRRQRIVMSACMARTVPNATVAYICDRDEVLMDFWQRAHTDYKGQWLVVVGNVGIGMAQGGVQVKFLREWGQELVEGRRKALRTSTISYSGRLRTHRFLQHAFEQARVDALQVCWMTLAGTRTPLSPA